MVGLTRSAFLLQQERSGEGPVSGRELRAMGRERWGDIYANMPMKKMVSLYDYDPQELSPNVDSEVSAISNGVGYCMVSIVSFSLRVMQVELSFRTGDIIYVYEIGRAHV